VNWADKEGTHWWTNFEDHDRNTVSSAKKARRWGFSQKKKEELVAKTFHIHCKGGHPKKKHCSSGKKTRPFQGMLNVEKVKLKKRTCVVLPASASRGGKKKEKRFAHREMGHETLVGNGSRSSAKSAREEGARTTNATRENAIVVKS